jgi:hypothetical protein
MLSPQDRDRVTQDAFDTNLKGILGESMAQSLHLKTQLDVANMELGVARDLIAAKDKEIAEKEGEIAKLKAMWESTTEGKDAALQASADEASHAA